MPQILSFLEIRSPFKSNQGKRRREREAKKKKPPSTTFCLQCTGQHTHFALTKIVAL
jgi:hypothetical protein